MRGTALDDVAVELAPLARALDELLAADVKARQALFGQLFLDDVLGGDRRVVLTGEPHSIVTEHAVVAGEDVLRRIRGGVAHVRAPGDVGRRHRDDERRARRIGPFVEDAGFFPAGVPRRFDRGRIVLVEHRLFGGCHTGFLRSASRRPCARRWGAGGYGVAASAFAAFKRPAPSWSQPPHISSALACRMLAICAGVMPGSMLIINPATPATCGAAMDVPEIKISWPCGFGGVLVAQQPVVE